MLTSPSRGRYWGENVMQTMPFTLSSLLVLNVFLFLQAPARFFILLVLLWPPLSFLHLLFFKCVWHKPPLWRTKHTWQSDDFVREGGSKEWVRDGGGSSSLETKLVLLVSLGLLGKESRSCYLNQQQWTPVSGGVYACVCEHLEGLRSSSSTFKNHLVIHTFADFPDSVVTLDN